VNSYLTDEIDELGPNFGVASASLEQGTPINTKYAPETLHRSVGKCLREGAPRQYFQGFSRQRLASRVAADRILL